MGDMRAFWDCNIEDVPRRTGAAGLEDCSDLIEVLDALNVGEIDQVERFADVGCGTGRACQLVNEDFYIGFDISLPMIEYAKRTYTGGTFIVIDGPEDLAEWVNEFEIVVAFSLFTHISADERRAYLSRFYEMSGELIVDILPAGSNERPVSESSFAAWFADTDEFEGDLGYAGYKVKSRYERKAHTGYLHRYYYAQAF